MAATLPTPEQIYLAVKEKTNSLPTTICQLHKPCTKKTGCLSPQQKEVIDFDRVELVWHQATCRQTTDSVDALTYTKHCLCMVELKGWKRFLEYQEIARKNNITTRDEEVLTKRIEKQSKKYKLQDKLLESIHICEEITGIKNLTQSLPVAYILVTDIDPNKNAVNVFAQQLNVLAHTSTDWETVCAEKMRSRFDEETKLIKEIRTIFIYCREFDETVKD